MIILAKVFCSVAMDVFARMQIFLALVIFHVWTWKFIVTAVCQQSLGCTLRVHVSLFSFRVDMVLADFYFPWDPLTW